MKTTQKTLRKTRKEGDKEGVSCFDLLKKPSVNINFTRRQAYSLTILIHIRYSAHPVRSIDLVRMIEGCTRINIYNHLNRLSEIGYIQPVGASYIITEKGREEVDSLRDRINTYYDSLYSS